MILYPRLKFMLDNLHIKSISSIIGFTFYRESLSNSLHVPPCAHATDYKGGKMVFDLDFFQD